MELGRARGWNWVEPGDGTGMELGRARGWNWVEPGDGTGMDLGRARGWNWVEPGDGTGSSQGMELGRAWVWNRVKPGMELGRVWVCDDPPEYAGLLCHHLGCFSVVYQLKQSLGTLQQHLVGEEGTTITTLQ